jgi:hypothetical protein
MQSGCSANDLVGRIFESNLETINYIEPLMGWIGSTNTIGQIRLKFKSLENAENYAKQYNLKLIIKKDDTFITPPKRKAYADNFKK